MNKNKNDNLNILLEETTINRVLSCKEWSILVAVLEIQRENYKCPSIKEIAKKFQTSTENMIKIVSKLERKGYLHLIKKKKNMGNTEIVLSTEGHEKIT